MVYQDNVQGGDELFIWSSAMIPYLWNNFVPTISNLADGHPLTALLYPASENAKIAAFNTDSSIKRLQHLHKDWLQKKTRIVLEEKDLANISAVLGEIRAYGELTAIWPRSISAQAAGADFSVCHPTGHTIKVEVNTPQKAKTGSPKLIESSILNKIEISTFVQYPLGEPESTTDNVQGEATSRLSSIKEDKEAKQFQGADIAILWVDLQDPSVWNFNFWSEQFCPVVVFRENLTSGSLWSAWYGEKDLPVFDNLPIQGCIDDKPYKMEFKGRFARETVIDFLIVDTADKTVVFQNHVKSNKIPDQVYQDLYCLSRFNLEKSWLDWPVRSSLRSSVEMMIQNIKEYEKIPDNF